MKVYALSQFDSITRVDVRDLRRLIAENRILAFRRADGWVRIGADRIRGDGGDYGGPERREVRQKPLPEMNGLHYCLLEKK